MLFGFAVMLQSIAWFLLCSSSVRNTKASEYEQEALFDMHDNYFPTRLLAWTESLHVAIFCALIRESHNAAIFVLDPVALNACSKIIGITKLNSFTQSHYDDLCVPDQARLPEYPVAINGNETDTGEIRTEKIFTLHGTNELPLEEQCPNCVVKVVLTREEQSFAENGILSGMWLL
jgi:hypothetical protein